MSREPTEQDWADFGAWMERDRWCPRCGGSGTVTVPSDNGPDPEELDADCDHCGGKQTLQDAYAGVCQLLQSRSMSHMHMTGRYLAMRDALMWVMTATGEGIASAFDNAKMVLTRLEGMHWRKQCCQRYCSCPSPEECRFKKPEE